MATKDDDKVFSLDSFQKAAEKKYGTKMVVSLPDGKKTELRSPFKLSDEAREKAFETMEKINTSNSQDDDDGVSSINRQVPMLRELLTAVGDENTPQLLEVIEDDLGTLIGIFEQYQEEVKLGEAQASPEH